MHVLRLIKACQGGGQAQDPKGQSQKLNQLAYIAHPKLGKHACGHIAEGLGLCCPKAKAKAQTEAQAGAPALAPAPDPAAALAPKGAQSPTKAPV